jgi:hypothetical protein
MPTLTKVNESTLILKDNTMTHYDRHYKERRPGLRGEAIVVRGPRQIDPRTGMTVLGENVVRREPNEILLGGSLYALEKMFNVSASLHVDYLNNIMNIGTTGPSVTEKYPKENGICLWTVGLGGCGDSRKDITAVYQQQRTLNNIIPFRVVEEPFAEGMEEYEKYFLMRQMDDGKYAYYGKSFAETPVINALWKDAAKDVDGSPVVESDYTSTRDTPIEAFAVCVCTIEKDDFREWFDLYDEIDEVRFNEIGLCTGVRSTVDSGRAEYKQVRQASCCHFTNDPLHMEKDMSIIYRWYSA